MYYLLGYKIETELDCDALKKDKISENTFILALDGDINFRPDAVRMLVDLMRKNKNLGAACGRIHPIGSGPLVWYQMFEYAVSHWLQKAAEHMYGCVLCSPGCFSLFRAKALRDTNVMHKYTTKPTEAIHYLQYDQGEDRWLCTLLLQQGWRVEYCAASDAYTHCPESFEEFYTQRRRWGPSTIANIIELLNDYKRTVEKNENISRLYIGYQFALLIGTVLSPGTIFLMLVGAMNTTFGWQKAQCLTYAGLPIIIFILICFFTKNNYQILTAQIFSTVYAVIMLSVLIATAIEIVEVGVWQPSSIYFIGLCLCFVIAAFLHPTEFKCLFPIVIYLLTIPSMYLLLIIYSIVNLHVVSWGTREIATQDKPEDGKKVKISRRKSVIDYLHLNELFGKNEKSSGLFTCVCCGKQDDGEEKVQLMKITEKLDSMADLIKNIDPNKRKAVVRGSSFRMSGMSQSNEDVIIEEDENQNVDDEVFQDAELTSQISVQTFETDYMPFWIKDEIFERCQIKTISEEEHTFWCEFIEEYLLPLDQDPMHQKRVASNLKGLRNRVVFLFGMINVLFLFMVLILQMHPDVFSISFQFDPHLNETINEIVYQKEVKMDAIALGLVVFFAILLFFQFIGMLLHRIETLAHLLAFIEIILFAQNNENVNEDEAFERHAVYIAKSLQKLRNDSKHKHQPHKNVKRTSSKLTPEFTSLDVAFQKRFMTINSTCEGKLSLIFYFITNNIFSYFRNRNVT